MRISENPVPVLARKCYCRVERMDCVKYRGNKGMGGCRSGSVAALNDERRLAWPHRRTALTPIRGVASLLQLAFRLRSSHNR